MMSMTLDKIEIDARDRQAEKRAWLQYLGIVGLVIAFSVLMSDLVLEHIYPGHGIINRLVFTKDEVAAQDAEDAMLRTVITIKVMCPGEHFAAENEQRWVAYATKQRWTPYPAAGRLCYDP